MLNKTRVMEIFDNYEGALKSWEFTADRVCNIDETGVSTIVQFPGIVAQLGKEQVRQAVSGERGTMITVSVLLVILYHQFSSFQEQDFMTY